MSTKEDRDSSDGDRAAKVADVNGDATGVPGHRGIFCPNLYIGLPYGGVRVLHGRSAQCMDGTFRLIDGTFQHPWEYMGQNDLKHIAAKYSERSMKNADNLRQRRLGRSGKCVVGAQDFV